MRRAAVAALAVAVAAALVTPLSAQDAEPARTLIAGPGAELTAARCGICHEVTHITRARLSRGEWQDNVRNMIERGAPIAPAEVAPIVDYLATYYSRDSAPPAAAEAPPAAAGDPVARLLAEHGCNACHALGQKLVGPSFREVAARYAGDAGAAARLGAKIRGGGAGAWGTIPMPPHPRLADDDLGRLAGWVLEQR